MYQTGDAAASSSEQISIGPHEVRRRISAFAFSHSTNFASPDSIFRSRSANSSSCQAGDSIAAGSAERLYQSASMVCSFSSTLISFSGHSSNYITRVSKIDILKEGMKTDGRKRL